MPCKRALLCARIAKLLQTAKLDLPGRVHYWVVLEYEGRRKSVSSSSRNPSRDWLLSTTVEFANKSQSIYSKKFRLLQVCFTLGIAFCRIDILLFSCTLVSLSMVDVNVSFANAFHFTRILICFSAIIIRRPISASCCYV